MNYFSVLFISLATVLSSVLPTTDPDPVVDYEPSTAQVEAVQKEIGRLLRGKPLNYDKDQNITVVILVNKDQEVLVLDLNSEEKEIRQFIKDQLNGRVLKNHQNGEMHTYICPLRLKLES